VKQAVFHPRAIETIRGFPEEVKDELGQCIFLLQQGKSLTMPHSRPMPGVGAGVEELRVRGRDGIYRAFYYSRSKQGVLVFHAFVKKTAGTPWQDMELGRRRLLEMRHEHE
jgi:phage-related protein